MAVGDSQNTHCYGKIRTCVPIKRGEIMLVKKAFKFRIFPNQKQIELINKT
ncbi:helix-turn-helix domain-containing protein, partial [Metabacillus lacus]|uniref:helix-turn-helix domain-containing protein n=1 Tax=Metabacillus lacus TaxID=1983721 RepID=UPI0031B64513